MALSILSEWFYFHDWDCIVSFCLFNIWNWRKWLRTMPCKVKQWTSISVKRALYESLVKQPESICWHCCNPSIRVDLVFELARVQWQYANTNVYHTSSTEERCRIIGNSIEAVSKTYHSRLYFVRLVHFHDWDCIILLLSSTFQTDENPWECARFDKAMDFNKCKASPLWKSCETELWVSLLSCCKR